MRCERTNYPHPMSRDDVSVHPAHTVGLASQRGWGIEKGKTMKTLLITGAGRKEDNGSGYNLAGTFPKRRFHDKTVYVVTYNGIRCDRSTIVSIRRSRNGFGE